MEERKCVQEFGQENINNYGISRYRIEDNIKIQLMYCIVRGGAVG
jgi:hypothetical protein